MANGKEYDVMGYWDCPVCQTKKIKGTVRDCPNCGAPRGKDVRFYMDGEDVRLTEEEEKKKGKGADWMCEFCGAYNSALSTSCTSCGAEKTTKSYFDIQKEKEEPKPQPQKPADVPKKNKKFKGWIVGLIAVALLITGLVWMLTPKTYNGTVKDKYWESSVEVEKNTRCYESDWSLPSDAKLDKKATEIRTYRQVQDARRQRPMRLMRLSVIMMKLSMRTMETELSTTVQSRFRIMIMSPIRGKSRIMSKNRCMTRSIIIIYGAGRRIGRCMQRNMVM